MNRRQKIALFIPLAIVGFALFITLGGQVVMRLWNWLTPTLFGWHAITFWQALGLLALCRILFGGFGGGGGSHYGSRRRIRERCENMTPEERQKLAERLHDRWGHHAPPQESRPDGR
jgi:hypothetical protein